MNYQTLKKKIDTLANSPNKVEFVARYVRHHVYWWKVNSLLTKHYVNGEKKNSILLASAPKSGNTFFRFVWLNILFLNERNGQPVDFVQLDQHLPFENFLDDFSKQWEFQTLPCLLKSHRPNRPLFETFVAIHLFRNPLDQMISFYNYMSKRVSGPPNLSTWLERLVFNDKSHRFTGTFPEFLEKNLGFYCEHFSTWIHHQNAVPISYEALFSEHGVDAFRSLLNKLDLKIDDDILQEAFRRAQPSELKNAAPSDKMSKLEMNFIRNAKTKQYKEEQYFDDVALDIVRKKLKQYNLHSIDCFPKEYQIILEQSPWDVW